MAGNPVRVAILGGGLAETALLQALLKHNLDVHIFESAPKFRESGNAIGLVPNARSVLDLMGLRGLRDGLTAAKAVQANRTTGIIAQGKDSGKISMVETQEDGGSWIVQRSLFLAELLLSRTTDLVSYDIRGTLGGYRIYVNHLERFQ